MSTKSKSKRKSFDINFLKTLPGIFLNVQLICCSLGFLLGLGGEEYRKTGHKVFLFFSFFASFTTTILIAIHFLEAKSSSLLKDVNWNKWMIVHSAIQGFLVMVGSACMVDVSFLSANKAAGVFGFLGFTAYLVHLCWEVPRFIRTKMPPSAVVMATISDGAHREATPLSDMDEDEEDSFEPTVVGQSFNPRPQSSVPNVQNSYKVGSEAESCYLMSSTGFQPTRSNNSHDISNSRYSRNSKTPNSDSFDSDTESNNYKKYNDCVVTYS